KELGKYFLDALKPLEKHPIVGEVRGLGMWLAIDFTADKKTRAPFEDDTVNVIVQRARQKGILIGRMGTAIEIAPALTTKKEELDKAAKVIEESIREVSKERNLG